MASNLALAGELNATGKVNLSNDVNIGGSSLAAYIAQNSAGGSGVTIDANQNTYAGDNVLSSLTGQANTAFGAGSMVSATEGGYNSAGISTLQSLTTGSNNTAVGNGALQNVRVHEMLL